MERGSRSRQRPRRALEYLDHRRRRQGRAAGVEREALVREQPDVGRRMATTSSRGAISSRSDRSAPAKSGCSTPTGRRACRSPSATASRRMPGSRRFPQTAGISITARTSRRARRSNTTRIRTATIYAIIQRDLADRPRAARRQRPGRIGHAASVARRQAARLRQARAAAEQALRARSRERPRPRRVRASRQGSAGGVGRFTASIRSTRGCRTARRWSSGARARSGASTWRAARASRSRSPRRWSRRSTTRCDFRRRSTRRSSRSRCCATSPRRPTGSRSPTVRSARSMSVRCQTGDAAAGHRRRDADSQFYPVMVAGRPVDRLHDVERRGLRPRAGHEAGRHRRPRRRDAARALHRAVVLARRQDDRLPERRRRRRSAADCTASTPGIYVVPADGRRRRGSCARAERSRCSITPASASTCSTARREVRAVQRRPWRRGPACRRATRSSTSSPRTPCRSCPRRTASGSRSKSGSTPTLRRFRTRAARSTSARRQQLSDVQRVSRDAGIYLHWSGDSQRVYWTLGPSSSSAISRAPSPSSIATSRSPTSPRSRACRSGSPPSPTCRTARSPSSVRASSRWPDGAGTRILPPPA